MLAFLPKPLDHCSFVCDSILFHLCLHGPYGLRCCNGPWFICRLLHY